jgi:hypothetical protein
MVENKVCNLMREREPELRIFVASVEKHDALAGSRHQTPVKGSVHVTDPVLDGPMTEPLSHNTGERFGSTSIEAGSWKATSAARSRGKREPAGRPDVCSAASNQRRLTFPLLRCPRDREPREAFFPRLRVRLSAGGALRQHQRGEQSAQAWLRRRESVPRSSTHR